MTSHRCLLAAVWALALLCSCSAQTICKDTAAGREFMGNLRVTTTNLTCQSWASQTPNAHPYTQNTMFPDGSAMAAGNQCRNPDETFGDGPWCYTTDPKTRWQVCNVPLCPKQTTFCKETQAGREFKGHLTVTKSGKACQSWNAQTPNAHPFTNGSMFADGSVSIADNRCRNPDSTFMEGPWCYTTDRTTRWELCAVTFCAQTDTAFCKDTHRGDTFMDDVRKTRTGKTCQAWSSQTPQPHRFTVDSMFPDRSVLMAANQCRNPSSSMPDGPWCFTTDPTTRWEYCDIDLCPDAQVPCKLSQAGKEFKGDLKVTRTGKACQSWAVQTPNPHGYTSNTLFPDGSVAVAANNCRNPDSTFNEGPWCYTLDRFVPWEVCDVKMCPKDYSSFCKDTKEGREFKGDLTYTKGNRTCQSWASQTPNPHPYGMAAFPDGSASMAGNRCRNPDPANIDGPWCYTTDPRVPWEACEVPLCPNAIVPVVSICKDTVAGREFKGNVTRTKSGKTCQSWAAQSPNRHTYTADSLYPDGSALLADNRCRNPDASFNDGPWCYTTDPVVRWEVCDIPVCVKQNGTYCKETQTGRDFTGDLRKTKSGKDCQSWASQTPTPHNFTSGFMFSDGSVELADNRCRNPDSTFTQGPWCFTTDPNTRWELCEVPFCDKVAPSFCKDTQAGREFKGHLTTTKTGKPCQSWNSQSPNTHSYTAGSLYPDGSVAEADNRCRNPDMSFSGGPWCYTTDPSVRWEECEVPFCPKDNEDFCKLTPAGRDFMGNLRETKSGRICQSWASQTPNKHNFTADSQFPDGSAKLADNRCRNPDPNFLRGPWCYTNDPAVPWEECTVPLCPKTAPSFCKETPAGREFKGHLTVTKSGKPCQSWNAQTPNIHTYTADSIFPDGSAFLADNRCRNPDPSYGSGPWCYTTDPSTPWEDCEIPLCEKKNVTFCKESNTGRDFKGNLTVTKSGKFCQSWNSQTPFAHNFTSDFMFPDGSVAVADNRCRNPDPSYSGGPWCFTTDPLVRWEPCEVPLCANDVPTFCKLTPEGREFKGHLTTTKSGKPCQSWAAQSPNPHSYTADTLYPDGSARLADNRCRNPDKSFTAGPWCYTTDPSLKWEICDVPLCPKENVTYCKLTPSGRDFIGNLRETKSGRICQSWNLQFPNKHNFSFDSLFPDATVLEADNRCRNPDATFTQGPWCYTTDPAVPWELCEVPLCPKTAPTFCKETKAGRDFTGHVTMTKSGKPCQSWHVQSPNRHTYTADSLYPDGSAYIADNRCRNPDPSFTAGPWCYTLDPIVKWEECEVPLCQEQAFCKETPSGRDFTGDLRKTKSGKDCQSWASQTPTPHNFTSGFMFADGSVEAAGPRCRNPDPTYPGGPWCFTTDPNTPWEPCDVPQCDTNSASFCKETPAGREFKGHVTVTKSGYQCQSWDEQTPNTHAYTDGALYPDGSTMVADNRCRNPDASFMGGPWCYTTDPKVRWEVCNVPLCEKEVSFCKKTPDGRDFMGNLQETKSGRICQDWFAQTPNKHNFTEDSMYPDGSALQAGHRCRNPDATFTAGPWCFTLDPAMPKELCNVPLCPSEVSLFCKATPAGREFKGHLTQTKSGLDCQSWNAQTPNAHSYTADSLYPDGKVAVADNRCRNPDASFSEGPWCYTTDPKLRWEVCEVPLCPENSQTFCKDTPSGREFTGDLKKTKSGKICQSWNSQTPTPHNFTSDFMFPDGSVALADNRCRNPDPTFVGGPWCFTTDPDTKWEQCDVPVCNKNTPSFCKETQAGREFKGHLTTTKSGFTCQSWNEQTPNAHSYTADSLYPDGSAKTADNRCRNPDKSFNGGPWCYTTDPVVRWEVCDVPFCQPELEPLCKLTPAGRDFMGNVRETKSGRICQSWSSQTPNKHNFTADSQFPDKTVALAENRCRNPDPNFSAGPWCFTNDPAMPREECSVPLCPPRPPDFCKDTWAGRDFKGHLTVTKSGKPCQSWSKQTPNAHTYTKDTLFPDGSALIADNRCRNPDASFNDGPWCYTTDPSVKWEVCNVPMCQNQTFCKDTQAGREFDGDLRKTKSGKICQSWNVQTPNAHNFTSDFMYADGSIDLADNRCRNPDPQFTLGPWCYTTDPSTPLEACDVPFCPRKTSSFCKETVPGREFKGHLTVTKSGLACQSWGAQTPNSHTYTADNLYPDGSAAAADNRCRNPDASFNGGPWCYTTDPTKRWEECEVPLCPKETEPFCKRTTDGRDFDGNLQVTRTGRLCQSWAVQTPNKHNFTADNLYPDGSALIAGHRCRNPDATFTQGPWCYTTDPAVKWELCEVPLCQVDVSSFCKETQAGREFTGHLTFTKSGKECQKWSSQTPNAHPYTTDNYFPDGSITLADNRCRSPDPGFNDGPWCYTTDPTVKWEVCDVQMCPKLDTTFCKETSTGRDFKGNLTVTRTGKPCQSWNTQSPVTHNFTSDFMFPDGSVAEAANRCRNPDPQFTAGPWCFTTDPNTKWEECSVPPCDEVIASFCKDTQAGREFRGHVTTTKSGYECQSWGAQTPNAHTYTADNLYPDGSAKIADNRCRNPDASFNGGPWCYTTDPLVRWEVCEVPLCPKPDQVFCKSTAAGRDFTGNLRETKSGRICQSWASQTPNAHNFTKDSMYPDGSVKIADNRCRNPDPTFMDGPWCFTNDPAVKRELCDVTLCADQEPTFCKQTISGRTFKGHLTVTKSGKPCQSWNLQTPNRHSYTDDSLFPDGSVLLADNRCRNPDSSFTEGPWCYTTDPTVKWEVCDVQMCLKDTDTFCKTTVAGREFKGNLMQTKSGRSCQAWSSQTPCAHNFTVNSMYPDGSVLLAGNKCRNPDPTITDGPWCFTTDPLVRWEYCDVSPCETASPSFCKTTPAGREFKGHLTVTKSGRPCQSWAAQTPNRHTYTQNSLFPDGSVSIADNRCRNPDSSFNEGPWCYTTDPAVPWEVCDVPVCPTLTSEVCKDTAAGREFTGNVRRTKSGKTCQAWSSQFPYSHTFTMDSMFPDGSVALADNRCRNPDQFNTLGPWCFTTDPSTRMEQCDVPLCPKPQGPCKDTQAGREFSGNVNMTKSGKPCQSWAAQTPNTHTYTTGTLFPDGSAMAAGNRCRNPDKSYNEGPWCYTTDPWTPWEVCDIPTCIRETSFCKETLSGRDFKGHLTVTRSGLPCQSWNTQSPNTHPFKQDSSYPDGSVELAGNRCRNPDPAYDDGPWCYTTDATVRWEPCNVPLCTQLVQSAPLCKTTPGGTEFKGDLTKTKSGKLCQSWAAQTPNKHTYTSDSQYADGSAAVAANRCRNPDSGYTAGPWCYTTDPKVPWELCDVPFCPKAFCKSSAAGRDFTGHLTTTKSGYTCQSWAAQTPNAHGYTTDSMYPDGSVAVAANRCRNPDATYNAGPWCYTTDPKVRWEVCEVPMCSL